jgi:hypothetical protein
VKIKTIDLKGGALDYAVALAEGTLPASFDDWRPTWPNYVNGPGGDDIIDREKIETRWIVMDAEGGGHWLAANLFTDTYGYTGVTRREAAMRCYVASKLGAEVEVPEELCHGS